MPSFGQAARNQQAKFRKTSDTISQEGRSPLDIQRPYLLAQGYEEENLYPSIRGQDGARRYFEDREIQWWSHGASGDRGGIPTRNMASSQIACVNFLLPLMEIEGALTAVLRAMDGDVQGVIPIEHGRTTSPVELEWIGVGGPLESDARAIRGALTTSVDAFMVAKTSAAKRAYLLEWKYVEEYEVGNGGNLRRSKTPPRRYSALFNAESSSFKSDEIPLEEFFYEPFYQLMRQRLLADRMVNDGELSVTDAKVVAVVPEGNDAYRNRITSPPLEKRFSGIETVSDVFRATLKQPDSAYGIVCPSVLVAAVERECGDAAADWVAYQRERYGL